MRVLRGHCFPRFSSLDGLSEGLQNAPRYELVVSTSDAFRHQFTSGDSLEGQASSRPADAFEFGHASCARGDKSHLARLCLAGFRYRGKNVLVC